MESNIDFSLDMNEINAQIEEESLMPAELVISGFKILTYTDDDGSTSNRNVWQLEWKRLDKDLGEYRYRSSHNLPDPNSDRPVTQRRQMSYVQQVDCFSKLGVITSGAPDEFIGQRHWIKEATIGSGRFQKTWWKSECVYVEGISYEESKGSGSRDNSMNPPTESSSTKAESATSEEVLDENSPYTLFLNTVDGLSHRQAISAVETEDKLKENEEIMTGVKSGNIFEEMIEQGLLKEEDGKYIMVS